MRHIYVKTPNGLGKLNFYDGSLWLSHYIVDHYKHDPKFYSGYYEGRYITNASCYSKRDIKYLRKRPLIDLITKRRNTPMQNIYVYDPYGKVGKLIWYKGRAFYSYVVTYNHSYEFLYNGLIDGRAVINCMVYSKDEIKLLHKKPLRHFIEKREGK